MVRKFKLWNQDRTEFIDMSGKDCFVTSPENLGIGYELTFNDSNSGRYLENKKPDLTDISLKVNFGLIRNAYETYEIFRNFIAENDRFVLEYIIPTKPETTKFRDVYVKKLSRTEKNEFRIIQSDLILAPITPWYREKTYSIPFNQKFYLNSYSKKAPIKLVIQSNSLSNLKIYLEDDERDRTVHFRSLVDLSPITFNFNGNTEKIVIDSFYQKMYWLHNDFDDGDRPIVESINLYGRHNLNHQSFLIMPEPLSYSLAITGTGNGTITATVREWL